MEPNRCLTHLDLSGNRAGDEGASALADLLETNSSLSTLLLTENDIGDEGTAALADALKMNRALTTIHMGRNAAGDSGMTAIAQVNNVTVWVARDGCWVELVIDRLRAHIVTDVL
jgi:hypothetical protein